MRHRILLLLAAFLLSLQVTLHGASPITTKINPRFFASRSTDAYVTIVIERDPSNWTLDIIVEGDLYERRSTVQLYGQKYSVQNILHLRDVPCGYYSVVGVLTRKVDGEFKQFRSETTMECPSAF